MILGDQIQAILYHLMMGIFYGILYSFTMYIGIHLRLKVLKAFLEIVFHIFFTLLMFYGLYKINGGITNLYLILLFLFGVFLFYKFYYSIFQNIFRKFGRLFIPFLNKYRVVKNRMFVIIKVPVKIIRKWRRKHVQKIRKRKTKEKETPT